LHAGHRGLAHSGQIPYVIDQLPGITAEAHAGALLLAGFHYAIPFFAFRALPGPLTHAGTAIFTLITVSVFSHP
jgi:hypothetical protein